MTILYFVLAALALGVLVFIHELGHYWMARRMGMTVEVFSIGFGKPIIKWRSKGVSWQLCYLPFGGYVKIAGMEFGKKDQAGQTSEPYDIPNGFFSKSPIKRIMVAIAGPAANFLLAIVVFSILFFMGGREKPFSEFTQIVGWVDPDSELYQKGLRPGDKVLSYNGKPYKGSKDLLFATMLGGKEVDLKGEHINYATGEKVPFDYRVTAYLAPGSLDGILTTGILESARFLIYDKVNGSENPLPEGSPMIESGIEYGDRIVWADGEVLFSMEQLSHILNDEKALLLVKRGNEFFFSRQKRVVAGDLVLPPHIKNDLLDWQYEGKIKGRWTQLKILPYVLSANGFVESPLNFLDEETKKSALHGTSPELDQSLQPGDRILAVDGYPVSSASQILSLLQERHVRMIVEKGAFLAKNVSSKEEDAVFARSIKLQDIQAIASTLGTENPLEKSGKYQLLKPVEPKHLNEFALSGAAREKMQSEFESQKKKVQEMREGEKKNKLMNYLMQNQNKYLLGIYLQDLPVRYNPGPFVLLANVCQETWATLKALLTGHLNPKWLSGPVGIVNVIQHGWRVGLGEALFWIGAISLNLGILNILPIPVLDGGYICLSLWELITKKRLKAKTMEKLIIPFVILLVGLLIFLTFQDLSRLL